MAPIFKPMEFSPQKLEINFWIPGAIRPYPTDLTVRPQKVSMSVTTGGGGWMQLSDKDFQLSGVREKYVHSRF